MRRRPRGRRKGAKSGRVSPDPRGRKVVSRPQDSGPGPARPDLAPKGTATPEGCSGKARPQSWTRSCLQGTPPPTSRYGAALSLCTATTASRMTQRNIAYPPYRGLPPPSPYRMRRRGPQPVSRSRLRTWEQRTRRWAARSDPAPALRLRLTHAKRALPPPHHPRTERSLAAVACALHALQGPSPRLLGLEDILMGCFLHWTDTGADPRWGLSALQCVPQRLGSVGPRPPRGPWLAVWRSGPALAVPPPPLEGGHATLPGRPPAGAPLGPGSPPRPPCRSRRTAGLDQRSPAPGAPGRGVGRRGGGLRGPLGGYHPRWHHEVPSPGRQAPSPLGTRSRPPARCWPPSRGCLPCGTR